jgi:glycosyltransferase involved in cell wall biosynthesis
LDFAPKTSVTVLVPARNEAANISACLHAILACNYPQHLLEILVLDDFSTDDTARIVSEIATANAGQVRLIRLEEQPPPVFSGKKKALELGVSCARGELIATTDADCLVPTNWLLLLVSLFEVKRPGAIVAPVLLHRERTGFQRFQALDFAGMMGITGAGIGMGWHLMGNGANLCYAKSTFEAVGGYAGNMDRASGDDLFLLGKIAAPACFLKNPAATVRTLPSPDLRAFVQQRLRWGTKNAGLPDPGLKAALAVVFLFCCTILLNTVLLFFLPILGWVWLAQLALKAAADYVLLREMCTFFERRVLLRGFWPAFFVHTAYIAGIGAGSLFVKKYVWKGRRVR